MATCDVDRPPDAEKLCETQDCNRPAKLQCPTCIKLGIKGSFFCSQVF